MAVRTFHDPDGREWSVWDVVPSRKSDLFLPATMAEGWLCFEAAHEKRRLHPFPPEWDTLAVAALWELCCLANPVKPRPPRPAPPRPQPQREPS